MPVRPWVFYVALGFVLILVQMLFLWLDNGLEARELLPVIVFNGFAIPYLLGLVHLLDRQAAAALDTLKPVLTITQQAVDNYRFSLSNMPVLAPLVAGLALTALMILTPLVSAEPVRYEALDSLPIFSVAFQIVDKGSAFLFGVTLYHTVRQLRLVNRINSNHIQVDLFNLRPLQAFSKITATTALGLMAFIYSWMLINPDLFADPILVGYILAFTFLAVLVFILPLQGAHRLIQLEKDKTLHDLELRLAAVFARFNQRIDDNDIAAADELSGAIATLEIQHRQISAVSSWPWSSETARFVLTAIALPLVLMLVQFFVLRALE